MVCGTKIATAWLSVVRLPQIMVVGAKLIGHELYGHAYMYSVGKPHGHIGVPSPNGGFVEENKELGKQIKNSMNEAEKNYNEQQLRISILCFSHFLL